MEYVHEVKYYECDRMGITHHSNYMRIMEEARIAFLDSLGYGFDRMEAEGVSSPVVSISCSYRRPTTFKDMISVDVRVAAVSELKLTLAYTMTVGGDVVFTAESVHCFMEAGKPLRILQKYPFFAELCNNQV